MSISKSLLVAITVIITGCYFFPFVLEAFPIANSKMVLAALGLVVFGINLAKKNNAGIDLDFANLSLWALGVSLVAYTSITANNTPDDTFVTYFMSMWVWMGGAYFAVMFMKYIHGDVSVPVVVNYLLAVCVVQCVLALIFNNCAAAEAWHASTFGGEGYMGNTEERRLHGIGCSLDVAGFRFAAVICMATFWVVSRKWKRTNWTDYLYLASICFISLVGNMISRSTIIGTIISIVIICISAFVNNNIRLVTELSLIIMATVGVSVFLYKTDPIFRSNLAFGFEGFFSLIEKGEWQTNSNNILKNMVIWPDNLKTWLIGDGYFNNPSDKSLDTYDPYFVGKFHGYYMGTDIGYLRYIFYFGVVGLATFSTFFVQAYNVLRRRFPSFKWMFFLALAINFIQWIKVSTDLFVVFAPFLCLSFLKEENGSIGCEAKSKLTA